jgi:hypothetical protein
MKFFLSISGHKCAIGLQCIISDSKQVKAVSDLRVYTTNLLKQVLFAICENASKRK